MKCSKHKTTKTARVLLSLLAMLTFLVGVPAFAQNHYKLFDPVNVASVAAGSTFNTVTLSLTCSAAPTFSVASDAAGTGRVFIDNYIARSINGGALANVCTGGTNDAGVPDCFQDRWKTDAGGVGNVNPDTATNFLANYGVPTFSLTGLPKLNQLPNNTNLTLRLDMVDNGGYIGSSSIYANTNCTLPSISGFVYIDADMDGVRDATETGPVPTLYAKLRSSTGTVLQVAPVDASTGTYSFTGVVNGSYIVIIDTNNLVTDTAPAPPTNYQFVPPSTGSSPASITSQTAPVVNFGIAPIISGTVFEDVAGTGASSGIVSSGVNVRLYADVDNDGVIDAGDPYISQTTTDASGLYSFTVKTATPHYLIAVNSKSVTPSAGIRAGFTQGDVWAVQTYGDSSTTPVMDLGPRFGGRNTGTSDKYLAADTSVANNNYQHIARVDVTSGPVTTANFGFSFNVVTNTRAGDTADDDTSTNRTVQGSFRQFLQNARAIAGANAMRFVPTVATNASGAGGNFWHIGVTSALPLIDDASTTIDGTAFSSTDGTTAINTNTGSLGTGGSVGVDGTVLPQVTRPELEIVGTSAIPIGFNISGASAAVRDLAIYGFGTGSNVNTSGNIIVATTASTTIIESSTIGTGASAFADPGATRSVGDNIRILGTPSVTVRNNLIGFSAGKGIDVASGSTVFSFTGNEVRGNGIGNTFPGLDLHTASANINGNLFAANTGTGLDTSSSAGSNTIVDNTVTANGATSNYAGIRIYGSGSTVDRNIINSNGGSGILVNSSATSNIITRNSIYQNGSATRIGIDLLAASDDQNIGTSPFVTINDSGDGDAGANGLLNFPVITSAVANGANIVISGFARPGASIEFFLSDTAANGFGQGKTYLTTLVEGSGSDTDATTGTYGPSAINGVSQGTDPTNKFTFSIALPPGVTIGSYLTATATLSNSTSEFSGVVQVLGNGTTVSGNVYEDANHNGLFDTTPAENWTNGPLVFVNLVSGAVVLNSTTVAAASTGAFAFASVLPGTYTMVVTNSATNTVPVAPSGFSFIQPSNGTLTITVGVVSLTNQTFGLFSGSTIAGTVFADNGASSGTANDGAKNGGETGLSGVTVYITDAGGSTVYATTTSSSSGAFSLYVPGTLAAPVLAITNPPTYVNTGGNVGNTGGTYSNSTARIAFTNVNGSVYTGLFFGLVPPNTFDSTGELASAPGTSVVFPHIYTPSTVGAITFSVAAVTTPSVAGFTQLIYRDVNCNGIVEPTDIVISVPVATVAGTPICILLKDFIPVGAPVGTQDALTVTAAFTYANNGALVTSSSSLVVHDLTRVDLQSSTVRLVKTVNATAALPGATLTYTLSFFNAGATPISDLVIFDSTPAYTVFVSAACPATLPPSLTGCTLVSPAVNAAGNMSWTFTGTLLSGQTGVVTFQTKIQ